MQGIQTKCSVCGVAGKIFGIPTGYERCADARACADRVKAKLEKVQKELEKLKTPQQQG